MGGRGIDNEDMPTGGSGGGGRPFIPKVMLRDDGEFCRFRFLTEHDEIFWERFHKLGQGSDFRGYTVCLNSALDQDCERCEKDEKPPTTLFLAWVYEFSHFYPPTSEAKTALKKMKERDKDIVIKKTKIGSASFFEVEVNEPMLMQYSTFFRGPIKARAEHHGTLLDRPFEWIRNGERRKQQLSYVLEGLDKEKMPEELKELMASLPDLEDVALGRVETLEQDGEEKEDSDDFLEEKGKKSADDDLGLDDNGDGEDDF